MESTHKNKFSSKNSQNFDFLKTSIDNLDLRIYFNKVSELYKCVIKEGDKEYESVQFTLQSSYHDGIIQDSLGEINSDKFFSTFGPRTQSLVRRELLTYLQNQI